MKLEMKSVDKKQNSDCLPPGSRIGNYVIDELFSQNGESAVYAAFNAEDKIKVWIKEFLPLKIARRNKENLDITVEAGGETRYKYFKASFEDINKTMKNMLGVDCLIPVLEFIEEHNTIYMVYKYIELTSLEEYLQLHDGEELWCKAKKYLLPLYNGVSNLHKKGITHQGICPANIYLDKDMRIYLGGFSISEVRTDNGELETELFSGYSAPEQYHLESWQGTWTDVYSLSAVTYRILTGTTPPPATERVCHDDLIPANELDFTITENISNALAQGMALEAESRYQNVDEFTGKMLESLSSNTAVFKVTSDENQDTLHLRADGSIIKKEFKKEIKKENEKVTNKYTVITMAVTLILLIIFGTILYNQLLRPGTGILLPSTNHPVEVEENEPESPAPVIGMSGNIVPNFIGQNVNNIIDNFQYTELYHFEIKETYSEEYPKGSIIEQSPDANTAMAKKGSVTLTVSIGSELVAVPNFYNKSVEYAESVLDKMGFYYSIKEIEDQSVTAGSIFRTEPPAYTQVKKGSSQTIILYVAKSPPVPKVIEPEPEKEPEGKVFHVRPGKTSEEDESEPQE